MKPIGSASLVVADQRSPASPEPRAGGLKLDSIQYLRAFAAAAVVLSHAADTLLGRQLHLINLTYGAYGVDIFFVVSGFIMYYTTFDRGTRPSSFLIKRLIRIFPLYFILSTAMFLMVAVSPASFNKESDDAVAYLESIFFVPHWNPRLHDLQPIIGPGWTLNFEMFFYVIFAATLFIRHRFSGIAVLPVIVALVALGRVLSIENPLFITYTSPLMLEFCLGIVVAASFINSSKPSLRFPVGLAVLLGLGAAYCFVFKTNLYGDDAFRPLFVGLPCAILVTALVALERSGRLPYVALFVLIGDASYSLYLVHGFILGVGQRLWHHYIAIDSVLSHAIFITLVLATSITIGIFVYRHLEVKVGRSLTLGLRYVLARRNADAATREPIAK